MGIIAAILVGFLLAAAAPWVWRVGRGAGRWAMPLVPLALTVYFASLLPAASEGVFQEVSVAWAPSLGLSLSFRADGLALLFALLITGIGTLIFLYTGTYLAGHRDLGRFYAYLAMFMASMLGLVLADNLVLLFIFWELTSISSFLLIGFDHERAEARAAALQALLVTTGGGLALLAGVLLLGQMGGTMEISRLVYEASEIREHALYLPALLLIAAGAFTKSAQYPCHFWLPAAMEAPTPVSAYLHSATMVKAGVYLLARLAPVLGGTDAWWYALVGVGSATMLAGGFLALVSTDLKQILAYSTVSALGTLTLALGVGDPGAVRAAVVFLLAHAMYKGSLFLVAGTVDHEAGTRDATQLGGLWRAMPVTALAAALASLALAGFGPLLSFIGKEMLLEAAWESEARLMLSAVLVATGAAFAAVAGVVGYGVFFGRRASPETPHEAPVGLWIGPMVLALAGVAAGLYPDALAQTLIAPAAGAILGPDSGGVEPLKLVLWHGLTPALGMSVASIALGLAAYAFWPRIRDAGRRLQFVLDRGPARWYSVALDGLAATAAAQTRLLQSGYLRFYLMTILGTTVALVGFTFWNRTAVGVSWQLSGVRLYEFLLAGVIVAAAIAAVRAKTRLAAVAALGVVGYCVGLVFILFGAPDLAMTQFTIETLTVILFVLVLYRLPRFVVFSSPRVRFRDAVAAGIVGTLVTLLVLVAIDIPHRQTISGFFVENSYPAAHGRNVVNVILVDFRGFDTLGEITVLAVAAVGIYSLVRLVPADLRAASGRGVMQFGPRQSREPRDESSFERVPPYREDE